MDAHEEAAKVFLYDLHQQFRSVMESQVSVSKFQTWMQGCIRLISCAHLGMRHALHDQRPTRWEASKIIQNHEERMILRYAWEKAHGTSKGHALAKAHDDNDSKVISLIVMIVIVAVPMDWIHD